MLRADTEEKRIRISEILGDVYHRFQYEVDDSWEEITKHDGLYIDGDITFDKMAEIVDYLRGK